MITPVRLLLLLVFGSLLLPAAGNFSSLPQGSATAASLMMRDGDSGLQGWLLVTDDPDWKETWNEPKGDAPQFSQTDEVGLGGEITVLILYANPAVNSQGRILLECDIRVIQPDGTTSEEAENLPCGDEMIKGPRENIRLASVHLDFTGEIGDPYGRWSVEVTLRDRVAGTSISLQSSFDLVDSSTLAVNGFFLSADELQPFR